MKHRKCKLSETDLNTDRRYQKLQRHLKLQGLAPATIQSYSHSVREAIVFFGDRLDALSRDDLSDYFEARLQTLSAFSVYVDLAALKFYTRHVLQKPWLGDGLFKLPRSQKLPDIVTVEQIQQIVDATRCLSYRVYFFTVYSLGLRLSEGLRLQIQDIDAERGRVHVRQSKGCKDRLVPLPDMTLVMLRQFWAVHRNPKQLFPSRVGGLACSAVTDKPLDASGVRRALRRVCKEIGIKKHHSALLAP